MAWRFDGGGEGRDSLADGTSPLAPPAPPGVSDRVRRSPFKLSRLAGLAGLAKGAHPSRCARPCQRADFCISRRRGFGAAASAASSGKSPRSTGCQTAHKPTIGFCKKGGLPNFPGSASAPWPVRKMKAPPLSATGSSFWPWACRSPTPWEYSGQLLCREARLRDTDTSGHDCLDSSHRPPPCQNRSSAALARPGITSAAFGLAPGDAAIRGFTSKGTWFSCPRFENAGPQVGIRTSARGRKAHNLSEKPRRPHYQQQVSVLPGTSGSTSSARQMEKTCERLRRCWEVAHTCWAPARSPGQS